MRIAIDARMYGLEHAGIGRYVLNLVKQIEKTDRKNEYFILLRKKYHQKLSFKNPRFKKILADFPHYSFKEQFFLPGILNRIKPDLVHFLHFNVPVFWQGRYLVTIHDLIKHQSRGVETTTRLVPLYWLKFLAYQLIIFLAIKRAKKIITPSQWWKKELVKKYHLKPTKVIVTYEGAGEFLNKKPNLSEPKILEKYQINKPFVVYTGSLYPHKNVLRLAKAVSQIRELSLVVVCARNIFLEKFKKKLEKEGSLDSVVLAGFVPDSDLAVFYQKAEAFVTPSLLEGFGLPGLEAMATGLPVVSSNASCLPEIYGQAAVYFDPLDIEEMIKQIKLVINNKATRKELIRRGYQQVKKYSWQKMTEKTLRVYETALRGEEQEGNINHGSFL